MTKFIPKFAIELLLNQAEINGIDFKWWPDGDNAENLLYTMIESIRQNKGVDEIANFAIANGANRHAIEAMSYCAWSIFEEERGNIIEAWINALDAHFFLGISVAASNDKVGVDSSGSRLANILHDKTTRRQRSIVEACWLTHIDHALSAQKAATAIEMMGVTTLSHKKIAEIVSAMRKAEALRRK